MTFPSLNNTAYIAMNSIPQKFESWRVCFCGYHDWTAQGFKQIKHIYQKKMPHIARQKHLGLNFYLPTHKSLDMAKQPKGNALLLTYTKIIYKQASDPILNHIPPRCR